jgi:hypothetical protein
MCRLRSHMPSISANMVFSSTKNDFLNCKEKKYFDEHRCLDDEMAATDDELREFLFF